MEGKPYLKGLEDFGKAVLDDLWTAVEKQFVEVSFFIPAPVINKTVKKTSRNLVKNITSSL